MSTSSWHRTALHLGHLAFWKVTRFALLAWGLVNGCGIGLVGQMKHRISRRVPRVSGSISV